MKDRKKFKDTKLGKWLKEKAPKVLDAVGDALPDNGVLGVVKNLIDSEPDLSAEDRLEFMKLANEYEITREEEVTKRWQYDMSSNSWLSKNIRPLTLASLLVFLFFMITLDAMEIAFVVKERWIAMYEWVISAAIGGYFVARTVDKNKMPWDK